MKGMVPDKIQRTIAGLIRHHFFLNAIKPRLVGRFTYINIKCMKSTLVAAALLATIAMSCHNRLSAKASAQEANIIGKEVLLTYPTMTAKVTYLSETQLHWQTTDGDGKVEEGTESLSYKRIGANKFFLNWIEQDGTTVSQVLYMDSKTIHVYMSYGDEATGRGGRSANFFEGKVQLVE